MAMPGYNSRDQFGGGYRDESFRGNYYSSFPSAEERDSYRRDYAGLRGPPVGFDDRMNYRDERGGYGRPEWDSGWGDPDYGSRGPRFGAPDLAPFQGPAGDPFYDGLGRRERFDNVGADTWRSDRPSDSWRDDRLQRYEDSSLPFQYGEQRRRSRTPERHHQAPFPERILPPSRYEREYSSGPNIMQDESARYRKEGFPPPVPPFPRRSKSAKKKAAKAAKKENESKMAKDAADSKASKEMSVAKDPKSEESKGNTSTAKQEEQQEAKGESIEEKNIIHAEQQREEVAKKGTVEKPRSAAPAAPTGGDEKKLKSEDVCAEKAEARTVTTADEKPKEGGTGKSEEEDISKKLIIRKDLSHDDIHHFKPIPIPFKERPTKPKKPPKRPRESSWVAQWEKKNAVLKEIAHSAIPDQDDRQKRRREDSFNKDEGSGGLPRSNSAPRSPIIDPQQYVEELSNPDMVDPPQVGDLASELLPPRKGANSAEPSGPGDSKKTGLLGPPPASSVVNKELGAYGFFSVPVLTGPTKMHVTNEVEPRRPVKPGLLDPPPLGPPRGRGAYPEPEPRRPPKPGLLDRPREYRGYGEVPRKPILDERPGLARGLQENIVAATTSLVEPSLIKEVAKRGITELLLSSESLKEKITEVYSEEIRKLLMKGVAGGGSVEERNVGERPSAGHRRSDGPLLKEPVRSFTPPPRGGYERAPNGWRDDPRTEDHSRGYDVRDDGSRYGPDSFGPRGRFPPSGSFEDSPVVPPGYYRGSPERCGPSRGSGSSPAPKYERHRSGHFEEPSYESVSRREDIGERRPRDPYSRY